jgi:hypothetical protein
MEYIIGFFVGMVLTIGTSAWDRHRNKTKRVVELEQEYIVLQRSVDAAVDSIERIIYGSKP